MKFNGNAIISKKAIIGNNVRIGDRTIIYDNVIIEDNVTIANDCVLGEPTSAYYTAENFLPERTIVGEGSLLRSHSIVYEGVTLGKNFSTGHRVTIRENSVFGDNCRLGTLCDIQGYVEVGDYCWFHSNVHIGQQSKIGNFVFIYPYVVLTNDPHPPSDICVGPTIGDYSQIAVFSVLLPGVKIGKHVLVGAHSTVARDVEDYKLVLGNPGKIIKDVREIKSRDSNKSHYPWPYNFKRGMPWEHVGYEQWIKTNS